MVAEQKPDAATRARHDASHLLKLFQPALCFPKTIRLRWFLLRWLGREFNPNPAPLIRCLL